MVHQCKAMPGIDWSEDELRDEVLHLQNVLDKRVAERTQRYRVSYTGTVSVDALRRFLTLDGLTDWQGNKVVLRLPSMGLPAQNGYDTIRVCLPNGELDIERVK